MTNPIRTADRERPRVLMEEEYSQHIWKRRFKIYFGLEPDQTKQSSSYFVVVPPPPTLPLLVSIQMVAVIAIIPAFYPHSGSVFCEQHVEENQYLYASFRSLDWHLICVAIQWLTQWLLTPKIVTAT